MFSFLRITNAGTRTKKIKTEIKTLEMSLSCLFSNPLKVRSKSIRKVGIIRSDNVLKSVLPIILILA